MITEYKIVCEGVSKKTIFHFSDSHLTEYDPACSEAEKEKALKATEAWERVRAEFCRVGGEPFGEFQKQSPAWHFRSLINASQGGDALVLTGDTFDYVSGANVRFTNEVMKGFSTPLVSVCGNHEHAASIPENCALAIMKQPVQTLDLGDLQIIGMNNSQRSVTDEQNETLEKLLSSGKKTLVAIHVPIMCEGNAERLRKSGVYFQFNYENCPEQNLRFIDIITAHARDIVAVLAGHLHYSNYALLPGGVPQIVASQAIVGNMIKYVIGGKDDLF